MPVTRAGTHVCEGNVPFILLRSSKLGYSCPNHGMLTLITGSLVFVLQVLLWPCRLASTDMKSFTGKLFCLLLHINLLFCF
jgi:hypothetical protein